MEKSSGVARNLDQGGGCGGEYTTISSITLLHLC